MINLSPVSAIQNNYFDAQKVQVEDLNTDQNYNNTIQSGIVSNHFGNGILLDDVNQLVLWDSSTYNDTTDGKVLFVTAQPPDTAFGNQIEVNVADTVAAGNRTIKVCLLGLDLNNNLIYETFRFHQNESQISKQHFVYITGFLVNDFNGDPSKFLNLGANGTLKIKVAKSLYLSRDAKTVYQDSSPNLFFRDFVTYDGSSLTTLLNTALPNYNYSFLIDVSNTRLSIAAGDIVSQIGQKFTATVDNIQKITILLSIDGSSVNWGGSLIFSVYPLQTKVTSNSQIVPNLGIEYDPTTNPIAQIVVTQATLKFNLDTVPQPIDFLLSDSNISRASSIIPGNQYIFTLKRAGTTTNIIYVNYGTNVNSDISRVSQFSTTWIDDTTKDLWYQVYSDNAKITSGKFYDHGNGAEIVKSTVDSNQNTVDYCFDHIPFASSQPFTAQLTTTIDYSGQTQSDITGNTVYSKKQNVPQINLLNNTQLQSLNTQNLLIGNIQDKNNKFTIPNFSSINLNRWSFVNDCIIINPSSVSVQDFADLKSYITNHNVVGSLVSINSMGYRITSAKIYSQINGDVDNNNDINTNDVIAQNIYKLVNTNAIPPTDTDLSPSVILGYNFYTSPIIANSSITYTIINFDSSATVVSGSGSLNISDLYNGTLVDSTTIFSSLSLTTNCFVLITDLINDSNTGYYQYMGIGNTDNTILLKKPYLTKDKWLEFLRACVRNNTTVAITNEDHDLLTNYIQRLPSVINLNTYNVGGLTEVIVIETESGTRKDDYTSSTSRGTDLHARRDIYTDLVEYNTLNSLGALTLPITFRIFNEYVWEDYQILVNNFAPTVFSALPQNDYFIPNNMMLNGQLVTKDGLYKIDFEKVNIVLDLPAGSQSTEQKLNIFTSFVAESSNPGKTIYGYNAMKFSDGTFVQSNAINNNQIKFDVSIESLQSTSNNVGVSVDNNGVLICSWQNITNGSSLTGKTKILITVSLKKSGFNNQNLPIDSTTLTNLFALQT